LTDTYIFFLVYLSSDKFTEGTTRMATMELTSENFQTTI